MPQALAFVAPAVFAAGGSVALFTAAGTLTLAGVAVSIGGSLLISQLTRPDVPDAATPQNIQLNSRNAAGPRMRHYGIVKVGGNVVFHRAKDGLSYRVIVHGHGELDGILQYYLNNEPVSVAREAFTLEPEEIPPGQLILGSFFGGTAGQERSYNAGDVVDDQYYQQRPRVTIHSRMGLVPETHYSQITDVWPAWTVDHRLDGLSSTLIVCESVPAEHYREMYPKNEPDLAVLAKGSKCLDPRTGATLFTENLPLAIRDYVASPDGFNRPDAFDVENIIEQADIADRDVALAAGGTEKLYRIGGSYLLNEKPQNVLGRMLQACAGRIRLKPSGKVGLKVGAWTAPEFTLAYGDILEVQEVLPGPDLLDRYNVLPARFNSHALGHIEVDAQAWIDEARIAEDGEELAGDDKNLLMCPSHRQARQVMKIHMERDNPKQEVTLLCKPKALPAIYEDIIALNVPQMALVGNYEVARHALSFERGLLKAVGLTLRKVDSAAFSLALAEQGSVQELPEPDTPSGVPVPQNVTAAAAGIQTATNTFVAGIAVGWQAPPSDALSPLLKVTKVGEENWQDVSVGTEATSITIPGLIDGQRYKVSLAFVTPGGVVGEAVIVSDVTASAVTDPPVAPTGLSVSDAGGGTALVEMTASTSNSLWKTEIYRDSLLVGVVYAGPGSAIAFIDNCGSGSFNWIARSVNVSNINSTSDAGPEAQTIT